MFVLKLFVKYGSNLSFHLFTSEFTTLLFNMLYVLMSIYVHDNFKHEADTCQDILRLFLTCQESFLIAK